MARPFLHAADDVQRRLREAQAVASITHPNVGGVYEVDPARSFIATEWVDRVACCLCLPPTHKIDS